MLAALKEQIHNAADQLALHRRKRQQQQQRRR